MDDLITLVADTYQQQESGAQIPRETQRQVWATLASVTRQEFLGAGREGLNPELVATTPLVNYGGERTVIIRGKRYGIYRTYLAPESDSIELYLEGKAGA